MSATIRTRAAAMLQRASGALCAAGLMLPASCSLGPGTVQAGVRSQCITVGTGGEVWPSSGTVDDFLRGAAADGATIDGFRSSGDGYVLGVTRHDKVSGLTVHARFLMYHVDAATDRCPSGQMVVTAGSLNGEDADLPLLGSIVAKWGTPPPAAAYRAGSPTGRE